MAAASYGQVIFIGPVCAGKSTLADLVSTALSRPRVSLDDLVWTYCADEEYSREDFRRVRDEHGTPAARKSLPRLFVRAVERITTEHPAHVIDLGAGHTHINDPVLFSRIRSDLAPCPDVVLLLPSPDQDESVAILKERARSLRGHDWVRNGVDHIERWVKDPPNYQLATLVMYTGDDTPKQTCAALMKQLRNL